MKEYSYPEKILLKLNLPSEQTEDRLLSFSDKLRFLIKSESTSIKLPLQNSLHTDFRRRSG